MYGVCLTCDKKSTLMAKSIRKAKWVSESTRGKGIPLFTRTKPGDKNSFPKKANIRVKCYVPQSLVEGRHSLASRKVLFWAAQPRSGIPNDTFVDAPKAYGSFQNFGITTLSNDGKLIVHLESPQPYFEEGKLFPAHFHFVASSSESRYKTWDTRNVYAVSAYPGHHQDSTGRPHHVDARISTMDVSRKRSTIVSPAQVRRMRNSLIMVNALPSSYTFDFGGSPGMHVPYTSSNTTIRRAARKIGKKPYVVFCAHSKCSAASQLIRRLVDAGAVNVFYMPRGILGWKTSQ